MICVYFQNTMSPMNHMNAEFKELQSVLVDGGTTYAAAAVHFDQQQELLWMGNYGVSIGCIHGLFHVSLHYSNTRPYITDIALQNSVIKLTTPMAFQKRVSFQPHS